MLQENPDQAKMRSRLAMLVVGVAVGAVAILAAVVIVVDKTQATTVFNALLPVAATWVGTVLAFYFGRENFESANRQVQAMVDRLSPEERGGNRAVFIMRTRSQVKTLVLPRDKSPADVALDELRGLFSPRYSRIPVLTADGKPLYMVHESLVDKYLNGGGGESDSLEQFVNAMERQGHVLGEGRGFAVVSERCTIGEVKQKLEHVDGCQDVFVTADGTADEPLLGWISNVRLAKYIRV